MIDRTEKQANAARAVEEAKVLRAKVQQARRLDHNAMVELLLGPVDDSLQLLEYLLTEEAAGRLEYLP